MGQQEGLAVNVKREFAIEFVDKSQPGPGSCLSQQPFCLEHRKMLHKDWHLQKTSAPIPNDLEQHCSGCSDMSHSQDALAAIFPYGKRQFQ